MRQVPRPLRWFVPSREEILSVPEDVKRQIGFKIRRLQNGEHEQDRDIKKFGEDNRIANLVKIVVDGSDGNTYRTAIAAEFEEGFWVLDVFNKQSKKGISTPKKDIDRIAGRLTRLRIFRNSESGQKLIREMREEFEEAKRRLVTQSIATKQGRQP